MNTIAGVEFIFKMSLATGWWGTLDPPEVLGKATDP
jgi:hypothetical protein